MICLTICAHCGKETENAETVDGKDYCEDCHDELFTTCESCNKVIRRDNCLTSEGGDDYCHDCYYEIFTTCESCNCEIYREDSYCSEDGDSYCQSCYHDTYCHCELCGCELHNDAAINIDGDCYCENCAPAGNWRAKRFTPSDEFEIIKSHRRFGIELETSACPDHAEIEEDTVFGCKDDGSIDGKEFVSPILSSDAGLEEIEKFCKLAKHFDVDGKCGFHIHLDMRDEDTEELKKIITAYLLTEQLWQSFVPQTRRENSYCRPASWNPAQVARVESTPDLLNLAHDRYYWLNLHALAEHGTLEIRLHTSTLDARKVCNWVKAHLQFVDYILAHGVEFPADLQSQFELLCEIWDDEFVADYYAGRASRFGTILHVPQYA